jgi:hypothetical protein
MSLFTSGGFSSHHCKRSSEQVPWHESQLDKTQVHHLGLAFALRHQPRATIVRPEAKCKKQNTTCAFKCKKPRNEWSTNIEIHEIWQ